MTISRSLALFTAAAIAEIGGAYLVWLAIRDDRGWLVGLAGAAALGGYGVIATFQPEDEFGRIFAAYGGIFIAGSIAWGVVFEGFRPDRWDISGAAVCLLGMGLIMYGPR